MTDYIKINGVSSETINVWVDTPPVPPMAKQRYTAWVTALDEGGTTADNTYEDISLNFPMYTFFNENYDNTLIYKYFSNAQTLEFSRHEGYYYKIKQVSVSAAEQYDGNRIKYTASLKLSPFRYKVSNAEISVANGDIVENTGTRYARPIYKITGSGNITLTVNGQALEITGLSGKMTIDCNRMVVYDPDSGTNLMPKTNGILPFLAVGNNVISWTGNISAFSLVKNERCY